MSSSIVFQTYMRFFRTGSAPGSEVDRAGGEVHPRTGPGAADVPQNGEVARYS